MDGVAEAEQIFRQISTVLPGDTGKERDAPFRILNRHVRSNNAPIQPGKTAPTARSTGPIEQAPGVTPAAGHNIRGERSLTPKSIGIRVLGDWRDQHGEGRRW